MLSQATTNSRSRNPSCRKRKYRAKLLAVPPLHPPVQQVKIEKEAKYKKIRKEKIQPTNKSKSLTISPTCKQNDNSYDSLKFFQTKSNESKIVLDDNSQYDEDNVESNIIDDPAKKAELR